MECNYTPKKRHKVPLEKAPANERQMALYGNKAASFLVSEMSIIDDPVINNGDLEGYRFYGQNVASASRSAPSGGNSFDRDGSSDIESSQNNYIAHDLRSIAWASRSQLSSLASKTSTNSLPFITHSFPSEQGIHVSRSLVDPWTHPSFPPLPQVILQRLATVNSVEMPNRQSFADALDVFLAELVPELRETAG